METKINFLQKPLFASRDAEIAACYMDARIELAMTGKEMDERIYPEEEDCLRKRRSVSGPVPVMNALAEQALIPDVAIAFAISEAEVRERMKPQEVQRMPPRCAQPRWTGRRSKSVLPIS